MKKFLPILSILIFLVVSCNKIELLENSPKIEFIISNNYVYSDTSISAGTQYTVSIIAKSENGENLTNLIVESNGKRVVDKGFNAPELSEYIQLTKTLDEQEMIYFIIRNKARKSDTIKITISKLEAEFSPIKRYNSIILGAQNNASQGSYFSSSNGLIYNQSEAFLNQEMIDLVYYFDSTGDENTFASPGANLTGIMIGNEAPTNWTIKRTSYFSREAISVDGNEFDSATNDSLIVTNIFSGGGRKAKQLKNDQYFGFQTNDNKYGIIHIESVNGQEDGSIQYSLIIQE